MQAKTWWQLEAIPTQLQGIPQVLALLCCDTVHCASHKREHGIGQNVRCHALRRTQAREQLGAGGSTRPSKT